MNLHLPRAVLIRAGAEFRAQFRSGARLLLSTVVAGGLSYIALAISARVLGPADFGLLGTLLAIAGLATLAFQPLYTSAAYLVSATRDAAAARGLAGPVVLLAGLLTVVLTGLAIAVAGPVGRLFASSSTPLVIALGPLLASLAFAQVSRGFLVGQQRFSALSFVIVLDALVRALLIGPLTLAFGVSGSVAAYLAGSVASSILAIWRSGGVGWSVRPISQTRGLMGIGAISLVVTLSTGALQNLDLVLLRSYAPADEVGWYAMAAAAGSVLFTLATPLYLPVYPRLVSARYHGKPAWPVLTPALLSMLIIGAVAAAAAALLGTALLGVLFGPGFVGAGALLPIYFAKTTTLLLLVVVGQYCASHGRMRPAFAGAIPVLLGIACLALFHPNPAAAALVMASSGVLAQATMLLAILGPTSARRHGIKAWRGRPGEATAFRAR